MSDIFDNYNYIAYPSTIIGFANELKIVLDDYKTKKIGNKEIKEIIIFYAKTNPEKLFDEAEFNITVKRILGKRRLNILETLLKDYQDK